MHCPTCCWTHCVLRRLSLQCRGTRVRVYISSGHLFGADISPNTFSAGLEVSVTDLSTSLHRNVRTDSQACDWTWEVELWSPRTFHGDSASLLGALRQRRPVSLGEVTALPPPPGAHWQAQQSFPIITPLDSRGILRDRAIPHD